MPHLEYRGLLLQAADLNNAVTGASGNNPPMPRKSVVAAIDGTTWLTGLIDAAVGTDFAEPLARSLDLVMRTGDTARIDRLAEVAEQRDVFSIADLQTALGRPHVWRNRDTPIRLARAIARAVANGRGPLPPDLRPLATERRLKGALLPAVAVTDPDWFFDILPTALGDEPALAAERLGAVLDVLPDPSALSERLVASAAALGPARADAVTALLVARGLHTTEAAGPEPVDIHRLPWRGDDGGYYEIPEGVEILLGSLRLRRGLAVRGVDPEAAARYLISDDRARQLRARQVEALWSVGRDALRAALNASPRTRHVADQVPDTLADALGAPTTDLLRDGPPDAPTGRSLLDALDTPETRAFVSTLADRLQDAAERAGEWLREEARPTRTAPDAEPAVFSELRAVSPRPEPEPDE